MPGADERRRRGGRAGANDAARRRALADATAGAIGSLASVLAFYPVDVWKTSLQAGVVPADTATSGEDADDATTAARRRLSRLFRGLPHKVAHTLVSSFTYFYVYSLVQTKYAAYRRSSSRSDSNGAASTATKLLLTAFAAVINTCITLPLDTISSRKQAGASSRDDGAGGGEGRDGSTTSSDLRESPERDRRNCLLRNEISNMNGASNGNIVNGSFWGEDDASEGSGSSARRSLSEDEYHSADEEEEDAGDVDRRADETPRGDNTTIDAAPLVKKQQLYIKSPEKYRFSFSTDLVKEAFATTPVDAPIDDVSGEKRRRLKSILSLWNGLFPSILLCTNPAIQYTMFDSLKNALLQQQKAKVDAMSVASGKEASSKSSKLSLWEAFLFGLISKFFATVITYPLIRCKVVLMVSSPEAFGEEEDDVDAPATIASAGEGRVGGGSLASARGERDADGTRNLRPAARQQRRAHARNDKKYPRSLLPLLLHIFRNDGARGIYRGCSLQLLHTVLKSALLMTVREKITAASHGFFRVRDDGDAP